MAKIKGSQKAPPTIINKILGINQDTTGETQLQLGECPKLMNYRILEGYKAKRREGYKELFASLSGPIRGAWYGKLNGIYHFLFAQGGKIYKHDLSTKTNTEIGTLTDDEVCFFYANNKVYMLNGHEYKSYDGTTFVVVAGYRPLIATATPAAGGGINNEPINTLTGAKRQLFSPNSTDTVFQLKEININSVDYVKNTITGTLITPTSTDLPNGKATITVPTECKNVPDSIEIGWTKGTGNREAVERMRFVEFYGGQNDTRIFLYGDKTNQYYYTGLADGVPSAEYIPVTNYRAVGSDEYPITDLVRQYDRLIIYKESEAWYSYYDTITDAEGNVIADFPTFPLNSAIGNVAPGQVQIINNAPMTIYNGVYTWQSTNIRDERNAVHMSKRVQPSLDAVDLTKAITIDWEKKGEYWLCIEKTVWIYNYRLDVWYMFELKDIPSCFIVINGTMYFGTSTGKIMHFDDNMRNDNGQLIVDYGELHFYDWGYESRYKNLNKGWISLKPETRTSVTINYETEQSAFSEPIKKYYNLATFKHANFAHWSFHTNRNPQPFSMEIDTEPFAYFKLMWKNQTLDETVTILSISLAATLAGEIE